MVKVNEIPENSGKIVEIGGIKAAIFNDRGVLKVFSTVCPHMACDVEWNGGAATWDCPCHGSRFTCDGSLINGPATRGLDLLDFSVEGGEITLQ